MTFQNLTAKAETMSISELKKTAIALKDATSTIEMLFGDRINDILIEKMPSGEFAKFVDEYLF